MGHTARAVSTYICVEELVRMFHQMELYNFSMNRMEWEKFVLVPSICMEKNGENFLSHGNQQQ